MMFLQRCVVVDNLVAVHVALVWTLDWETHVLSLGVSEGGQLGVDVRQVKTGDLLVEDLWENVDTDIHLAALDVTDTLALACAGELDVLLAERLVTGLEQHDLSKDLVGEGAGHDEGRVTSGTTKVDETTLGEEDDVAAVWHEEAVDLWLDVLAGLGVLLQPGNVNLNVKVTNVADNSVLWHNLEVLANKNVTATGGGDKDLTLWSGLLHGGDLVAGDGGLEGVDWVDLSDDDAGTHGVKGLSTTLTDITKTSNNGDLSGDHDIGGTLDTIDEGLAASVKVVEFALGDGVVDVDGWDKETVLLALVLEHAVKVVDTSGGLLGDTVAVLEHLWVLVVDESSKVTTVIEDQVERLARWERGELLLQAPVVLLLGLTLPGETIYGQRPALCRCHKWVLAYTGVPPAAMAAAAWSWVEKMLQEVQVSSAPRALRVSIRTAVWMAEKSISQVRWGHFVKRVHTHVQATSDTGTFQWLLVGVLLTGGHETRHPAIVSKWRCTSCR